jgi:hypothetical protein
VTKQILRFALTTTAFVLAMSAYAFANSQAWNVTEEKMEALKAVKALSL